MKKYLILSVSAGEGHNSVAKAIAGKLKENENNEVEILDLFAECGSKIKFKIINDGYILSCRYAINIFNVVFSHLSKGKPLNKEKSSVQKTVISETPKLLRKIYEIKPDVILVTHVFSAVILTNLKKFYPIPAKIVSILTDYMVHPYWEASAGVDYVITPSEFLEGDMLRKGFKEPQILPFGLPTREQFEKEINKQDARNQLGISQDMFTVMVMNGGCFGKTLKILQQLEKIKTPVQILLVNGKDENSRIQVEQYLSLNKSIIHKVFNYGFVKNVDVMMSASDCLVGKCGCISINESLNKELPLVATGKLPYQEIKNIEFLLKNNSALRVSKNMSLSDCVEFLMNNPKEVEVLKQNIRKIRKINALKDISNFLNSLPNANNENLPDISDVKDKFIISQINSHNKNAVKEKSKRKNALLSLFKRKK